MLTDIRSWLYSYSFFSPCCWLLEDEDEQSVGKRARALKSTPLFFLWRSSCTYSLLCFSRFLSSYLSSNPMAFFRNLLAATLPNLLSLLPKVSSLSHRMHTQQKRIEEEEEEEKTIDVKRFPHHPRRENPFLLYNKSKRDHKLIELLLKKGNRVDGCALRVEYYSNNSNTSEER